MPMQTYYVNSHPKPGQQHEVHTSICDWLPRAEHRDYLGEFQSCNAAVARAKAKFDDANGCVHCSRDCHTR